MSYLKVKNDPKAVNDQQALGVIDEIVFNGIKDRFDTDVVNFTWTNTEQWYKMVRQRLLDKNRQLKFPSIAVNRTGEQIDWQFPNRPVTGNKYVIDRRLVQSTQRRSGVGRIYEPRVYEVTVCDPPVFIKAKYNISVVTNMQQDYNYIVQDVLSIFEGGRTYLVRQQSVLVRQRKLMNRYGVYAVITGQKSQTMNGLGQGNRIFSKDFQVTASTYIYRNIQKSFTSTKNVVTFNESV